MGMKWCIQSLLAALFLMGGIQRSPAPVLAGQLQINLLPAAAVAAGAQWSVDGPLPVRASGTTTVLAVGIHTIYFTAVSGWTTPPSQQVTISAGQITTNYTTYLPVSSVPALAVVLTTTNTAIIAWPSPSTGWNLEQNADLTTTNWVAPAETITDDGTNKFIIVNSPTGSMFYRLKSP